MGTISIIVILKWVFGLISGVCCVIISVVLSYYLKSFNDFKKMIQKSLLTQNSFNAAHSQKIINIDDRLIKVETVIVDLYNKVNKANNDIEIQKQRCFDNLELHLRNEKSYKKDNRA